MLTDHAGWYGSHHPPPQFPAHPVTITGPADSPPAGHIQAPVRIKDAAERAAPPILPAHRTPRQSSPRSRAVSNPACAAEPSPILLCAAEPSPTLPAQQSRSPSPTRPKPPSLCTDRRSRNVVPLQPAARSTRRRRGFQRSRAPRRYPDQAQPCSPTCAPRLGAETRSPLAAPTEPSLRPDHVSAPWTGWAAADRALGRVKRRPRPSRRQAPSPSLCGASSLAFKRGVRVRC